LEKSQNNQMAMPFLVLLMPDLMVAMCFHCKERLRFMMNVE